MPRPSLDELKKECRFKGFGLAFDPTPEALKPRFRPL